MIGREALRHSDLFEGLSDDALDVIVRIAREESYTAGAVIFRENEPADDIYIVREGRVAILIDIGHGAQTVVGTVLPNHSFGWSAMVPPHLRTGTTKAMEKTRLIAVSGQAFRALHGTNCHTCYIVMEKLATIISRRLIDSRLRLTALMHRR